MEWPVSLQRLHANEGQDITGISLSGLSSSTCSSQNTQQQQLMPATLNDTFDRYILFCLYFGGGRRYGRTLLRFHWMALVAVSVRTHSNNSLCLLHSGFLYPFLNRGVLKSMVYYTVLIWWHIDFALCGFQTSKKNRNMYLGTLYGHLSCN